MSKVKKILLVCLSILILALFTGCSANYEVGYEMISPKPTSVNEFVNYETDSYNMKFKPLLIGGTTPSFEGILFRFKNKTDREVKINWDDSVFIDHTNTVSKIVPGETRKIYAGRSVPDSKIPSDTNLSTSIHPIKYIDDNLIQYGTEGYSYLKHPDKEEILSYDGERFSVILAINKGDKQEEYRFDFKIRIAPAAGGLF